MWSWKWTVRTGDRAAVLAIGLICGLLISENCRAAPDSPAASGKVDRPTVSHARGQLMFAQSQGTPMGSFESPFASVAEKVRPAVVNVNTKKVFDHPPIERNNNPFQDLIPEGEMEEFQYPSSASGFVFDPSGYVLTNNHVVRDAEEIKLQFMDGTEYEAEVVGVDPSTDIAVLHVLNAGRLPSLVIGNSDSIRVGDWAIAVGNPFGYLGGSVTVGVISALGRNDLNIMGGSPAYQNFIQTDASINFGNSGGPLVNIRGEVIGINTAVNPNGQGISFAIPMNMALTIATQLIEKGRVIRAYLGVFPQELTADLAEGKGLEAHGGILVGQVIPGTPAEDAGFLRGDVILTFDGEPMADLNGFRMFVAQSEVGRAVEVLVVRDGEELQLSVILAERPDVVTAGVTPEVEDLWLGMDVASLEEEPEIVAELDLGGEEGVLVMSVNPGSPAGRAGLEPGNLIQEINENPILDMDDYKRARELNSGREKPIIMLVRQRGYTQYLAVRPE